MCAAAILGTGARAGTTDQLHIEMLERLTQRLGVAVAGQHDVDLGMWLLDERQQHELSMPHGDHARVVHVVVADPLRHVARLPGGARDEADVAGEQRASRNVIESGLAMDVRHPSRT
jgi:hypothetical protein